MGKGQVAAVECAIHTLVDMVRSCLVQVLLWLALTSVARACEDVL